MWLSYLLPRRSFFSDGGKSEITANMTAGKKGTHTNTAHLKIPTLSRFGKSGKGWNRVQIIITLTHLSFCFFFFSFALSS